MACLSCNSSQNRFKNIYPCKNIKLILLSLPILCTDKDDHTRVELKKDPEVEGSDYINASFIDVSGFEIFDHCDSQIHKIQGYPDKKRVYIATQGNRIIIIHYFLLLKSAIDQF